MMQTSTTVVQPDPSTKFVIRISTTILIVSLAFLAWENWKIFLAMVGVLFHVIMYVQKELEGVLKLCQRNAEKLLSSVA